MRKSPRRWLVAFSALATVAVSILVNLLTGDGSPRPWLVVAVVVVVFAIILLEVLRESGGERTPRWFGRFSAPESRIVARPEKLKEILDHLGSARSTQVAITTGIFGAGGFGKTTLADMVAAHPSIKRRFPGGCYPITIGDGLVGGELASKINDLIELLAGERTGFTDPQIAGNRLGQILDSRPPVLLILDDVWWPEQLSAFEIGGRRCIRLVTTRRPHLLPADAPRIVVDEMTFEQAVGVLTAGLPAMRADVVTKLIRVTGRWPLLLSLVNSRIRSELARSTADVDSVATLTWELLNRDGPAVLDVHNAGDRRKAVRATVALSVSHLDADEAQRFAELGIFVEDVPIPLSVIATLWRATGGLGLARTHELVNELVALSLASVNSADAVQLHDVLRRYLRSLLTPRLQSVNMAFVDAIAAGLPTTDGSPMWWRLDPRLPYLWRHLATHLADAGRTRERDELIVDLRWVCAKLQHLGPALVAADLASVDQKRAHELLSVLTQCAHLLGRTDPPEAVTGVLLSRLRDRPGWQQAVDATIAASPAPLLTCRWPLPDSFAPELVRVLTGHDGRVERVTMSRDGSVVATLDEVGVVRVWNLDTGAGRELAGAGDRVWAAALAADGSWLVTADSDRRLRAWWTGSGTLIRTWEGHDVPVYAVAVAPDGTWLASAGADGTIRIWSAESDMLRHAYHQHSRAVVKLVISADGNVMVSGSEDGTARIWDLSTERSRTLAGHSGAVRAVAVAPDGSTVTTIDSSRTVRRWNGAEQTGRAYRAEQTVVHPIEVAHDATFLVGAAVPTTVRIRDLPQPARQHAGLGSGSAPSANSVSRAVLTGHTGRVSAIDISSDCATLATGSEDGTVRLWRVPAAATQKTPDEETLPVRAIVADPAGSWLAVGGDQGTTRIWQVADRRLHAVLERHSEEVSSLAVTADASTLVSVGGDGLIAIWDAGSGQLVTSFDGQVDSVQAVAVAPDGSWIANGGFDGIVRVWRPDGSQLRRLHTSFDTVHAIAAAPDGSWIATAGTGGRIRTWDVATWTSRGAVGRHTGDVYALAITPDSRRIVAGDSSGLIQVWDANDEAGRRRLTGHTGAVRSVDVSPSGELLVSGGDDATVRVWDIATGRCLTMMRVAAEVRDCTWLPDGSSVAVAGICGVYVFWLHPTGLILNSPIDIS